MHKDDAAARGIEEGDIIRLFNARGAIYVGVRITDQIRPGVVMVPTGAWLTWIKMIPNYANMAIPICWPLTGLPLNWHKDRQPILVLCRQKL